MDNAIKHSNVGGNIQVQLIKEAGKIKISFYNTGAGVRESEKEKSLNGFIGAMNPVPEKPVGMV